MVELRALCGPNRFDDATLESEIARKGARDWELSGWSELAWRTLIAVETLTKWSHLITGGQNLVFAGSSGTGKTYVARLLLDFLLRTQGAEPSTNRLVLQFHPSYSYEQFIYGPRVNAEGRITPQKGHLMQLLDKAGAKGLVIDELNRGPTPAILGEMFSQLEYKGEAVQLAAGPELDLGERFYLLATMNTDDLNAIDLDRALMERFLWIDLDEEMAEGGSLKSAHAMLAAWKRQHRIVEGNHLVTLLMWVNEMLAGLDSVKMILGHARFIPSNPFQFQQHAENVWLYKVLPMLKIMLRFDPDVFTSIKVLVLAVLKEAKSSQDSSSFKFLKRVKGAGKKKILDHYGLERVENDGEGLCQFYALAQALDPKIKAEKILKRALKLRRRAGRLLEANLDQYAPFFTQGNQFDSPDLATYCANLKDAAGRDWGGHLTLQVLAYELERDIRVLRDDGAEIFLSSGGGRRDLITLYLHGETHYEACVPKKEEK